MSFETVIMVPRFCYRFGILLRFEILSLRISYAFLPCHNRFLLSLSQIRSALLDLVNKPYERRLYTLPEWIGNVQSLRSDRLEARSRKLRACWGSRLRNGDKSCPVSLSTLQDVDLGGRPLP
jgi:hypothetical protein